MNNSTATLEYIKEFRTVFCPACLVQSCALLNPDDEVIVLDPNYVAYAPSVILSDGVVVPLKLKEENDFKIIPEDLKKVITPKTKAMIINYPSNPTGGVMTKEDYAKIIDIIKESGIYVIRVIS